MHQVTLPSRWYDEEVNLSGQMDLVPGDPPSREHPSGTVIVAEGPASSSAIVVTEWDLASGTALRETPLPVPREDGDVRMIRSGDQLHFLAWRYNDELDYAFATTPFQLGRAERLGQVAVWGPGALASDGSLTIVLSAGVLGGKLGVQAGGEEGYFAVTFDGNGRRVAARLMERPRSTAQGGEDSDAFRDNAAVLGGRAYVLLGTPDKHKLRFLKLRPDLSVERELLLDVPDYWAGTYGPTLRVWQDRLVAEIVDAWPRPPLRIIVSTTPVEIERGRACLQPPAPGSSKDLVPSREIWVGRVHVALYTARYGKAHLAWAEEDPPAPPVALCGAATDGAAGSP